MNNLERIYKAADYAKQDKDLINETFQFDDGKPYAIDKFNGINLSGLFTLSAYRVSPSSMDFYFKYKERRDYPEMYLR